MFFVLYIILLFVKKKEAYKTLMGELDLRESILSNLPTPWLVWDTSISKVDCSEKIKDILHLNDFTFITIEQIFKQLEATEFSPFSKAIQHLLDFGGAFQIRISVEHLRKELDVSGRVLRLVDHNTNEEKKIILICCLDLTNQVSSEQQNKKENKVLLSENEMLNEIVNEMPLVVWGRNSQGVVNYCNDLYADALNVTKKRILAENIEFFNSEKVNLFEMSKKAIETQKKQTLKTPMVINGNRRFLELAESPVANSRNTIGYALDITDLYILEDTLKKTLKGNQDILDALSIPIALFDDNKRLNFYNFAYQQLFDFEKRFLDLSPTLSDLLDDLRARRKMQEYADFRAHKKERETLFNNLLSPIEEVSYLPDGKALRICITPYPLGGVLFIFENITNQLDLERDVNTLLAVQKTTLDHLDEGILVIGNNGKLQLMNPAISKIWGVDLKEGKEGVLFRDWLLLVKKNFADVKQYNCWEGDLSNKFSQRVPFADRLYLEKGKVIEWFYVPLPDGSHMIGFKDVSDKWLHEQNLKARNLNLELTQKLKSDYVQEMGLELSPPIDDILGFSNTLRQELFGELNEKQLDYCEMIHDHANKLKTLLNDVLESIQLDHDHIMINFKKVAFDSFFENLEAVMLKKCNDAGVELSIHKKLLRKSIDADENRLSKAILGLISHFIRNTSRGEEISLEATIEKKDLKIVMMSPNQEGRQAVNSLNLGKSMAKLIIERHNGNLEEEIKDNNKRIICKIPLKRNNV